MIRRRQDWQTILANMIWAAVDRPFAWGEHDCGTWVADVVRAISTESVDLAADFRGKYARRNVCYALVYRSAAGGLEGLMEKLAGIHQLAEIVPSMAWRGDIALTDTELGPALGIIAGPRAVFVGPDGLSSLPRERIRRCWRIG